MGADPTATKGSTAPMVSQNDTKEEIEEETKDNIPVTVNKNGDIVCYNGSLLLNDPNSEKSCFSTYLSKMTSPIKGSPSVSGFSPEKFTEFLNKLPSSPTILIRSNQKENPTKLIVLHTIKYDDTSALVWGYVN